MFAMLPLTNLKNQFKSEIRWNQIPSFYQESVRRRVFIFFICLKDLQSVLMVSYKLYFILSYLHSPSKLRLIVSLKTS